MSQGRERMISVQFSREATGLEWRPPEEREWRKVGEKGQPGGHCMASEHDTAWLAGTVREISWGDYCHQGE